MLKRVATAAALIPVVVAAVWWGASWLVALVAAFVSLVALAEFFRLAEQVGIKPFRVWTMICAAALTYVQWARAALEVRWFGPETELVRHAGQLAGSIEGVLLVFAIGAAAMGVMGRAALKDVLPGIGASAAGLILIALPFSYVVRLDGKREYGPLLLLFTLALVWAGDSVAYLVGKSMGRMPMAPALSPKKTWEGAVANVAGSLLVGYFFARWQGGDWAPWLITAAAANVAGQLGDLIESAYKRGAGVKDSGGLLPGHGGMLDRIDSLIFAAPVVWFMLATGYWTGISWTLSR